ncbi:MAG: C40 family peptidase [candidate division Zixibacteria bacterium]|nr:C40 family peptidase [candidate division Zixibacteria bacterium]
MENKICRGGVAPPQYQGEETSPLQKILARQRWACNGIIKIFVIISFFLLVSCASYPRFTTHPPSYPVQETKIDKVKMTRIIESYLGEPYSKYDCSALVRAIYIKYSGINLPSDTKNLYKLVKKVEKEELSFGDLVFFTEDGFSPFHVGIYIGDNWFVHSSSSQGVLISSLEEKYYAKRFFGGRRVIQ